MGPDAPGRPLRFCIVSTFYPPWNFGGDGIYAHRLANGLARLGHQVTVLHSPTAWEMLAGRPPDRGYEDHPGVTVRPIRTPLGSLGLLLVHQLGRPVLQGPALRRALDDSSFDVIHYNNVSLLGGPHVFRMGRALKLCTLIEHWLVCPMHVLWRFDREVCTRPTCLRCTLHARRPPQWWRYTGLLQRASRSIDAFIGPSLFTMNMHRSRGLRGTMVQLPLFHPGAGPLAPEAAHRHPTRPVFLFVGRLEKIKGVQELIPLFRERPDYDLVVAGDGTYAGELRRQAADVPNIRFVGRVGSAELQALYRTARATLVPSLCYETFGVVVAESFSTDTPVIVRGESSLLEIVERHGGGLVYDDSRGLAEAVDRLAHDDQLRERLAREGREAYDEEFAEAPFLRHYLEVVEELRALRGQPDRALPRTTIAGRPAYFAGARE